MSVNLEERQRLIKDLACFHTLSNEHVLELAKLMQESHYSPNDIIATEGDLVDAIFIIVHGEVEVVHDVLQRKKWQRIPIATLSAGEAIGLSDSGFYSSTGRRTATVVALTHVLLLRCDIESLSHFLNKYALQPAMRDATKQLQRMHLIKHSLPFARLSPERLKKLADHIEDRVVKAGTIIFNQGDEGNESYLIHTGVVQIFVKDEAHEVKQLALLKSPMIFGEATLITKSNRNATARAKTDCDLLVLQHNHLTELLESDHDVASMFMTLMIDRSRPKKNSHVTMHERSTVDGQHITILKNNDNGCYFQLSKEGAFIWKQMDGQHTMQDITLSLADQFNVFAPNIVSALIAKLNKNGFITNIDVAIQVQQKQQPVWLDLITKIRQLLEVRVAFGDADNWISRLYQRYVRYLLTLPVQILLACFIVSGLISFIISTDDVLLFFSVNHVSLLLLLSLIPFSFFATMLHELGHAFAVKACGREVHYIGVGWYWLAPIAFTDTTDMWLSNRLSRIVVNLAGIYVDVLLAGVLSLLLLFVSGPYLQGMIWLCALYTYIGAFRMLSPLQDMDGYYVLMDWLEKPRLRHDAVVWLVKQLPRTIRRPSRIRKYWAEATYWLANILYLMLITLLTLVLQKFVFVIFDIQPANPYVALIIPFFVFLLSLLNIIIDIRHQSEE